MENLESKVLQIVSLTRAQNWKNGGVLVYDAESCEKEILKLLEDHEEALKKDLAAKVEKAVVFYNSAEIPDEAKYAFKEGLAKMKDTILTLLQTNHPKE